jgi:ribbon-helix-helix CopG family protein
VKRIRTVFHLDKSDREALERMSKETGAPLAELLRRAVAQYVRKLHR